MKSRKKIGTQLQSKWYQEKILQFRRFDLDKSLIQKVQINRLLSLVLVELAANTNSTKCFDRLDTLCDFLGTLVQNSKLGV